MKRIVNISLSILLLFLISSCKNKNVENTEKKSNIVAVHRFDQELFSVDIYSFEKGAAELTRKYPKFMTLFSNRIIEIGDTSSEDFYNYLKMFTTDQAVFNMYKRVEKVYPDFVSYSALLDEGFSKFNNFFPDKKIPEVYTYVSGFNQSVVTTEDFVGVSLEKYLGYEEPLYNELTPALPLYERNRMNPSNLVPDIFRAWIVTSFDYPEKQNNLLANMIHEGRSVYLLKQIIPDLPDTIVLGFDTKKLKFCVEAEKDMWTYLIEQKLLFITDQLRINQFIEEGPFTKDFNRESPARAAVWLGYRIVEEYMKRNKQVTLQELMSEKDFQKILSESRYNP